MIVVSCLRLETGTLAARNPSSHSESLRTPGFLRPAHRGKPAELALWRWVRLSQAGFGFFCVKQNWTLALVMEGRCWRPNPVPCSGHGMALLPKRDVFRGQHGARAAWASYIQGRLGGAAEYWAKSFRSPCLVQTHSQLLGWLVCLEEDFIHPLWICPGFAWSFPGPVFQAGQRP